MAKHKNKSSWIPDSLSRYNGALYTAILKHMSEPVFRAKYDLYLKRMQNYFGESDETSCLAEISAAGGSVTAEAREKDFDNAVQPVSQLFGLDLSRLTDPEIIERGKLILRSIKEVPKRLIAVAVLAGILFAGGENWSNIAEVAKPVLMPEITASIQDNVMSVNTAVSLKEALAKEEEMFSPSLPKPLKGNIRPYMDPEHADRGKDKIVEVLGIANSGLPEETRKLYADHIVKVSKIFGLNPALVTGIVIAESTGKTSSVSGAGAQGLMQVMWSVHGKSLNKKFGYKSARDLQHPEKGLTAGCWILKGYLERRNNDIRKALSAYLGTARSAAYYNKIMKWAKLAQPEDHDFAFVKDLAEGNFTNSEAEVVLKTAVMLEELGPMDAEDLVETVITFMPDASMERIADMAAIVIRHGKTGDGLVRSGLSSALEAEYMLEKIAPGFDRELCAVQFQAKKYGPVEIIGEKFASLKKASAVNTLNERIAGQEKW